MMKNKVYQVCVIGGGSAGTMAVLRTILNNDECLFFPGTPKDKKRSRAMWVKKVENVPAHFNFKRGIVEPNQDTLRWIEESPFKANLHAKNNVGVISLKKNENVFQITASNNEVYFAQYVILCTGVMDIQPEIDGKIDTIFDYANAQTVDYCLICDGHHVLNKKASVIGHTNSAAWTSIMLYERYKPLEMFILTNGKKNEFQDDTLKLINAYGIKIYETKIQQIIGHSRGAVLESFLLEDGPKVETDICFVSLGMIVYNKLALELGAQVDGRGLVVADESGLTTVSGLYVAGDLKANTKKQIYTAWDHAVSAANAINMKLRISKRPT
jgi:thioredoxin reductase (NADPH)